MPRRPDQQMPRQAGLVPGSRSGSIESAQALAYPGVPPGVPKLQGANVARVGPGNSGVTVYTFTGPGRLWFVTLSFFVITDGSYAGNVIQLFASVNTVVSGLMLASVELAVGAANQGFGGQETLPLGGAPVASGDSVILNISQGNTYPHIFQRATVSILYSIP